VKKSTTTKPITSIVATSLSSDSAFTSTASYAASSPSETGTNTATSSSSQSANATKVIDLLSSIRLPTKQAPSMSACEGIFPDYRTKKFQTIINAFVLYATTPAAAEYSSGVGALNNTNMFNRNCTGRGMHRCTKAGKLYACDACHVEFYVSHVSVLRFWQSFLNPTVDVSFPIPRCVVKRQRR
jgi:hypothetical protein